MGSCVSVCYKVQFCNITYYTNPLLPQCPMYIVKAWISEIVFSFPRKMFGKLPASCTKVETGWAEKGAGVGKRTKTEIASSVWLKWLCQFWFSPLLSDI